jgi:hypothetical protein
LYSYLCIGSSLTNRETLGSVQWAFLGRKGMAEVEVEVDDNKQHSLVVVRISV